MRRPLGNWKRTATRWTWAEGKDIMTEGQAREALLRWARAYWREDDSFEEPEVEILSLKQTDDNKWEAELSVSSVTDNPAVAFFFDDDGRIHVDAVEYG
jgi:hypothetical protein